jgi:hypothetical protein
MGALVLKCKDKLGVLVLVRKEARKLIYGKAQLRNQKQ